MSKHGEQPRKALFLRQRAGQRRAFEKARVPLAHQPGVVVGGAAQHHAVHVRQVRGDLFVAAHAAVQADGQLRKVALELPDPLVAQRRHFAVFLGAEALQSGIAGVHDEYAAARLCHFAHEVAHEGVAFFAVNADAVLDGDGNVHRIFVGIL